MQLRPRLIKGRLPDLNREIVVLAEPAYCSVSEDSIEVMIAV